MSDGDDGVGMNVRVYGARVIVESQLEHSRPSAGLKGTVDSNKPDTNSTQIIRSFSARALRRKAF